MTSRYDLMKPSSVKDNIATTGYYSANTTQYITNGFQTTASKWLIGDNDFFPDPLSVNYKDFKQTLNKIDDIIMNENYVLRSYLVIRDFYQLVDAEDILFNLINVPYVSEDILEEVFSVPDKQDFLSFYNINFAKNTENPTTNIININQNVV